MIALSGSLGDLITRSGSLPIYITGRVPRRLMALIIDSFCREFPNAELVNALTLYRHSDDRRRRWLRECERYGAAIVVTRAENRPEDADPFAGLAGEHAVSAWVYPEIGRFAHLRRPIGWHAVEFPAAYWLSRFGVEPFDLMTSSRWARLVPAPSAETFCPLIRPW